MNDIRMYNYYDDEPLVTRQTQAKIILIRSLLTLKLMLT